MSSFTPIRSPGTMLSRLASFDVTHFRFCREGGGQQISPGNRSGGSTHRRGGHAANAWRSARVSRPRGHAANAWRSARVSGPRRLARPPGLPCSSQTPVSEVFVLAELTPNAGDLSVKHLGGVRRPAPSAGSSLGRGQETRAERGRVPGWRTTNNFATSKLARRVGLAPFNKTSGDTHAILTRP
jgi:hypothetical protein